MGAAPGGMELVDSAAIENLLQQIPCAPRQAPGGSSGNTIFGLSRLGMPTAFLGKVGADANGEYYRKRLVELGGLDKSFRISTTEPTGRCLSMITPDSERTMRTNLGAATMSVDDIHDADFDGISHVHIEGYLLFSPGIAEKILTLAKKHSCTVSLDLATFELVNFKKSILPELLRNYVDIVFANADEATAFCGNLPPRQMAEKLGQFCHVACVKLGKDGSCVKRGNQIVSVPAELVKAIDTTGAGDLWQTGFLYGHLNGRELSDCARYGSIIAAEVVQVIGAEIPEPRWQIIREKLQF
jgi:sugar/nucleoside kinase (ribokinase family)